MKLIVSSDGLNIFHLLFSSSSSITMFAKWLGWACSLPQWCTLNFVITSRTVGIFRSLRISPFGTYRGAFTKTRSTLFWNRINNLKGDLTTSSLNEYRHESVLWHCQHRTYRRLVLSVILNQNYF